jgi:hypothetical protein
MVSKFTEPVQFQSEVKYGDIENDIYSYEFDYEREIVNIKFRRYIDADRAGFCGYVGDNVILPMDLLQEVARNI